MKSLHPLFAASALAGLSTLAAAGNIAPVGSMPPLSPSGGMGSFGGALAVDTCPPAPWQTQEKIAATGKLRCVRYVPACPSGFHYSSGSPNDSTGNLKCQPDPVPCPSGWTGGMVGGELQCTPKPAPKLNCPAPDPANAANPYGTSYYMQNWQGSGQEIGCTVNSKPAY